MSKINDNLNLERDDECYDNEYGDCSFFKPNDQNCLECKINRIKSILETIKFK